MWTSSAILYISLFCHQQTRTVVFINFSYTMISNVYFYTTCSMFSFFFNQSQSKAGVVNQMSHLCFRRKSAIGQLNVQTATTGKEKLYAWSTICSMLFLKNYMLFLSGV